MYLGIDLGTSAVKIVAVRDGGIVASASSDLTCQSPHQGWSEQNPRAWWQACQSAMALLLQDNDATAIQGIGLSGQMHGAVVLDKDRNVLRPCILWNDSRSAPECAILQERMPDIGQIGGVLPLPGFTAPKLMWIKEHEPDIYAKIAHILLPKDYIGLCLHGELAMDTSDAAGTLWLDQQMRHWSPDLCAASDTDIDWLPKLANGHDIIGTLTPQAALDLNLPKGIPVVAGGGDAATGAISIGAVEAGQGFISLGTSGQLFVAGDQFAPNPDQFVHAFAHTVPEKWYQMAAMLNGARPLSWFASVLKCDVADVIAQAEQANTTRVPIFLPYLTGERSPHGDPYIRASFHGLDDATDTNAMCRAVVEAISFSFADAAASFGDTMKPVDIFSAIGGGTRSDLVLQLIADAIKKPVGRSKGSTGGPAFGAALLATAGCENLSVGSVLPKPVHEQVFAPRENPATQARYETFKTLYKTLAPLYAPKT